MAAGDIVPAPGARFEDTLESASPDLLQEMIKGLAQRMMDADADADAGVRCNAGYGEVTPGRVNSRNGYRRREWDTRAGTIGLAIPKLREGSYSPAFLEHRRRAGRALASVVATSYLLGVSTRRVEKLAASLGVGLPKGHDDHPVASGWAYHDGRAIHRGDRSTPDPPFRAARSMHPERTRQRRAARSADSVNVCGRPCTTKRFRGVHDLVP